MSRAFVLVCLLAFVIGVFSADSRIFIADKVLYNFDLFTAYVSDPSIPYLPFVDEAQLCYLVGAISGCSGCQHGTQDLCSWVGTYLPTPVPPYPNGAVYQCVPKETSAFLQANDLGWNASFGCPVDPLDEPPFTELLWTFKGPLESERASLIHNTFHDLNLASVDTHPWPVDRTSLYSAAGGMELWGYNYGFFDLNEDIRGDVTCATLNDKTALDLIYGSDAGCNSGLAPHRLIDELLQGLLMNENDAFCLEAIWGSYLSTRCPKYGEAVSGIAYSLYLNLFRNCLANFADGRPNIPTRAVHIGPSLVQVALGVNVPFSILGLPVVPDGTPFALHDITVPPNEKFEEFVGIDSVHQYGDGTFPLNVFCFFD